MQDVCVQFILGRPLPFSQFYEGTVMKLRNTYTYIILCFLLVTIYIEISRSRTEDSSRRGG